MRLWSIHPRYLDAKGLVALWREGLLAQNVLQGNTKGYKNHPQLIRFKNAGDPVAAISTYLVYVADEADRRNYNFNRGKIAKKKMVNKIPVTKGQLEYELRHLLGKLKIRDVDLYEKTKAVTIIKPHSLFRKVSGDVEEWEIIN